jgi:hypothetical protein
MDKLVKLYLDDQIPKDGFGLKYKPLDERAKQIENQIPAVQAELDFLNIQFLSSDQILHEAKDLYSRWPALEETEKRRIIECITDRIEIGQDDISIHLSYLPSSSELTASGQRNIDVLPRMRERHFQALLGTSGRGPGSGI